ncbi:MAG: hypothetical protein Q7T78_18740 [Rhodoferax sp.]|nr:hypothetical protein [Rhodoferax sp.]
MSLPWNKSLELHIGTQAVWGTLRPAWSRHKVLASSSHAIDPSDIGHDAAAPLTAIDAVLSELRARSPSRGVRLSVVLTDARIHFDVVAGDYRDASERQLQSIATACVAELLGDMAVGQVVRWQLQPDLQHLLICSISPQDIESMVKAAARHGLSLASLQPEFCMHWNRHAVAPPDGTGVFATTNGAHAIVACVAGSAITALSCGPCFEDEPVPQDEPPAKSPLDSRVNRLLASVGLDVSGVSTFILVARDLPGRRLASRWTVLDPQQEPS